MIIFFRRTLSVAIAVAWSAAPVLAATSYLSNGAGGGAWTTSSTWALNTVPVSATGNSFNVVAGDSVTANSSVNFDVPGTNSVVLGSLTIDGGFVRIGRLNQASGAGTAGTVDIINGGTLSSNNFSLSGGTVTVNAGAGGTYEFTGTTSTWTGVTINVGGAGATFRMLSAGNLGSTGAGTVNLSTGGTIDMQANFSSAPAFSSWNGGRFITNSGSAAASALAPLFTKLSGNATNILDLSNKTSAQTLGVNTNGNSTITAGIIDFDFYGTTSLTNDVLAFGTAGTAGTVIIGSGVHLDLNQTGLTGTTSDYLNDTFTLFTKSTGSYSGITPTLDTTIWNIQGVDYQVNFTNGLSTDGTLTISSFSAVPEPSTYACLTLGLVGLAMGARHRRQRATGPVHRLKPQLD